MVIKDLKTVFKLASSVYVLRSKVNSTDVFLTYNVLRTGVIQFPKTIPVHRKSGCNVIYSINALNHMARMDNGDLNRDFVVDWECYRDSVVTLSNGVFTAVPTALIHIVQ